jgi:dTDP-4-amino-4,6-dideoxygalactose transaminase
VVTSSEKHIEFCRSFHNNGRGKANASFSYVRNGCNFRMTEFQAALLLEQLTRVEEQSHVREQNATYLASRLQEIRGIKPARMYPGCTRNAYHLFMFRYGRESFANLPRATFLKALVAEGIPCSGGYAPLDKEPFLNNALESRGFQKIYGAQALRDYRDRIRCPANDRLCEEAVWLSQTMLLGSRTDMDQIADAIRKIQAHAADLVKQGTPGVSSARSRG